MAEQGEMVTRGHLGGYVAGGDPATFYPALWQWLVEGPESVGSVLDVGCGEGKALDVFGDLLGELSVVGIDGVEQDHRRIVQHDFTKGPWGGLRSQLGGPWRIDGFDLVWCCEFVEHVEERFMHNFLETFKWGKIVLLTHAEPGQQGWHHVNCRSSDYWEGALAAVGFKVDDDLTEQARVFARMNTSPYNHFARSGLAFRRHPK